MTPSEAACGPGRPLPDRVVHADWSKHAAKRWLARAARSRSGEWVLAAPEPAGDPRTLVLRESEAVELGRAVLLGFDFPIGLPEAYGRLAGIDSFRAVLGDLGEGRWARFFDVASRLDEVSLERPFYPHGLADAGGRPKAAFLARLGVADGGSLLRRCEQPYGQRSAACELFWTKGGKQVGKAAIAGWREVLQPALRAGATLWPFDGALGPLLERGGTVLVETYPADVYGRLGVVWRQGRDAQGKTGKRVREDRQANAPAFARWADRRGVILSDGLRRQIEEGFGPRADGEDRFDAVVGLIGMLDTLLEAAPLPEPQAEALVRLEGWIFGQPVP
jgi:hypothetical protein